MPGLSLFHGYDFPRALNRLSGRHENQTLDAIRRLSERDRRGGLNDELLHRYASGLEVRSARITRAYRLIFARTDERIVVLWVDNHDEAYAWMDRHRGDIPRRFEVQDRPEPAPSVLSQAPFPVGDPDDLDELAARGYEHYFSALDEQQRFLVEFDAAKSNRRGLSFVTAGAGTGKTSIAIHRALHRAAQPDLEGGRVLYLCYNRALMLSVRRTIDLLAQPAVARQIEVNTFHSWAERYLQRRGADYSVAKNVDIFGVWLRAALPEERQKMSADSQDAISDLPDGVLCNEVDRVLSPNQFDGITPYLNLTRPEGQGLVRLRRPQREAVWQLHRRIRGREDALDGWEDLIERARAARAADPDPPRYRDVIVDEGQDCSPVMARLAKALVAGAEQRLLILADPAQSLYPGRFLWARREFGPRGRQALTLRRPYRSTRQIHALAASLYANVDETRREIGEMAEAEREGAVAPGGPVRHGTGGSPGHRRMDPGRDRARASSWTDRRAGRKEPPARRSAGCNGAGGPVGIDGGPRQPAGRRVSLGRHDPRGQGTGLHVGLSARPRARRHTYRQPTSAVLRGTYEVQPQSVNRLLRGRAVAATR